MRACTHGVGHTDNESAQHFDSEKLLTFFLVLRTGFEPLVDTIIIMMVIIMKNFNTRSSNDDRGSKHHELA